MKSFGKRNDNLEYRSRNGAYAVIQNESGQFLCVEDQDRNLYLIGGGIEADETPEEALIRESVEETGYKINIVKKSEKPRNIGHLKNIPNILNTMLQLYMIINY